jgi:hypothetical protein
MRDLSSCSSRACPKSGGHDHSCMGPYDLKRAGRHRSQVTRFPIIVQHYRQAWPLEKCTQRDVHPDRGPEMRACHPVIGTRLLGTALAAHTIHAASRPITQGCCQSHSGHGRAHISSHVGPASTRLFLCTPPHGLKKNGTLACWHWSRRSTTHDGSISRIRGSNSPLTITPSLTPRSRSSQRSNHVTGEAWGVMREPLYPQINGRRSLFTGHCLESIIHGASTRTQMAGCSRDARRPSADDPAL